MIEIVPNWHPIFVHFTIALWVVAAGLRLATHFASSGALIDQWSAVVRWNLWIGMAVTALTVAAGVYAYNTVNHDTPSHAAMTAHRNWALVTTLIFAAVVAIDHVYRRRGQTRSWVVTGLLLFAAALLLVTAWRGGELVYRHGLGVKSLPQTEGAGHAHTHGDDHSHGGDASGAGAAPEPASHDVHEHDHDAEASHTHEPAPAESSKEHVHAPGTPPHAH
jgi:uncharacterized membrane protein